jgi:hypothetical protein
MISEKSLRQLSTKRLNDARVLLNNKRYNASKYICGYAIELSLKLNICKIFKFDLGFPESVIELDSYKEKNDFLKEIKIRNLKIHDFNKLLFYSGKESDVKLELLDEWGKVLEWNPNIRYYNSSIKKSEAEEFYSVVLKVTRFLLK